MASICAAAPMLFSRVDQQGDLLARLQAGDSEAVAEAYDAHHAAVRGLARRLLADKDSAEDLVHDVFVALHKSAAQFRGEASLKTYLMSIAVNRSKHYARGAVRRKDALNRYAGEVEPTSGPGPELNAQRKQLATALERCLQKLPHDQRVVFVLCEVEQRDSREVGRLVNAPEGTVRTRLMHAKRKLKTMLEREGLP